MTSANSPDPPHRRPAGVSDETVTAVGKLSEALEVVEHARGLLYGFHRLSGKADLALGEAVGLWWSALMSGPQVRRDSRGLSAILCEFRRLGRARALRHGRYRGRVRARA